MKISVVICTHNRVESLRRTLDSLMKQTLPRDAFEVLVVNNASIDDTKTVTESFTDLPIKYIYEPKLGLSQARNTGWQAASSPCVAFLDDDAVAAPNWLESLLTTFESYATQEVVVGGRVILVLPQPKPDWLDASLLFCLGQIDAGRGTVNLDATAFFLPGCNMAFLRSTLVDHGGFPTLLGRTGSNLLSGEEILLQQKIKANGGAILYTDTALVKHHVDSARLTKKWFLKRMYWEGVTNKKIATHTGHHTSCITELKPLMQQIFSFGFLFQARFADVCIAAKRLGRVLESIRSH